MNTTKRYLLIVVGTIGLQQPTQCLDLRTYADFSKYVDNKNALVGLGAAAALGTVGAAWWYFSGTSDDKLIAQTDELCAHSTQEQERRDLYALLIELLPGDRLNDRLAEYTPHFDDDITAYQFHVDALAQLLRHIEERIAQHEQKKTDEQKLEHLRMAETALREEQSFYLRLIQNITTLQRFNNERKLSARVAQLVGQANNTLKNQHDPLTEENITLLQKQRTACQQLLAKLQRTKLPEQPLNPRTQQCAKEVTRLISTLTLQRNNCQARIDSITIYRHIMFYEPICTAQDPVDAAHVSMQHTDSPLITFCAQADEVIVTCQDKHDKLRNLTKNVSPALQSAVERCITESYAFIQQLKMVNSRIKRSPEYQREQERQERLKIRERIEGLEKKIDTCTETGQEQQRELVRLQREVRDTRNESQAAQRKADALERAHWQFNKAMQDTRRDLQRVSGRQRDLETQFAALRLSIRSTENKQTNLERKQQSLEALQHALAERIRRLEQPTPSAPPYEPSTYEAPPPYTEATKKKV